MRQRNGQQDRLQHTDLSRTGVFPLSNFFLPDVFFASMIEPPLVGETLDCEMGRFGADEVEGVGSGWGELPCFVGCLGPGFLVTPGIRDVITAPGKARCRGGRGRLALENGSRKGQVSAEWDRKSNHDHCQHVL